jgi:hypothetical protein
MLLRNKYSEPLIAVCSLALDNNITISIESDYLVKCFMRNTNKNRIVI